jgi:hypothetical protein
LLGTLQQVGQTGQTSVFTIYSQDDLAANVNGNRSAIIRFKSSNGTLSQLANNGQAFFGSASIETPNMLMGARVAIKQVDAITYQIYYQTFDTPGLGLFTVNTQNIFAYSGATSATAPTGTIINPSNFAITMNESLNLIQNLPTGKSFNISVADCNEFLISLRLFKELVN